MTLPFTFNQINAFPSPVGPFCCEKGSQVAIYATGFGGDVGRSTGFNEQHAQAILTPSGGMTVATVKLPLLRVGAPGDSVQIEIRQGSATGTVVGTSTGLLGSTIPTSSSVQTLTFTTPVVLAGSTNYWFIVRRSGSLDSSNHYRITYGTGGNYSGGNLWAKVAGGGWTENASYDLNIAISDGTPTYFMIARDLGDPLMLTVMKALDPSEDWGMWPTSPMTGFSQQIIVISATRAGDTIYLGILEGSTNAFNLKYHTYDMAFERWIINETVQTAFNPQPLSFLYGGPSVDIAFRTSDNQPVIYYNGAQVSNMGSAYARTYYARRTAAATWAAPVLVDIGGIGDWVVPRVILGQNNILHFFMVGTSPAATYHRSLSTANVLDTAAVACNNVSGVMHRGALAMDGVTGRFYCYAADNRQVYFASGANPTLTQAQAAPMGSPTEIYSLGSIFYGLYRDGAGDIQVKTSTDFGATWGAAIPILVATVGSGDINMATGAEPFQVGGRYVLPFIVNDNNVIKYSHAPTPLADAWSAFDKTTNIDLTNNDKTATCVAISSQIGVRSTQARANGAAGKYYVEFVLGSTPPTYVGVEPTGGTLYNGVNSIAVTPADGVIRFNGNATGGALGSALAANDVLCMAWDTSTERVWFRKNNGNWNNNPAANPATGAAGVDASAAAAENYALWAMCNNVLGSVTARTEAAELTLIAPTGFKSWMNEVIPLADAFDASDTSTTVTLSNNDKTATAPSSTTIGNTRGTKTYTAGVAGKYYAEFKVDVISNSSFRVGLADKPGSSIEGAAVLSGYLVNIYGHGTIGRGNNTHATGSPLVAGDVVSFAWDSGAKKGWARVNAGLWNYSAAANPETGTGAVDSSSATGGVCLAACLANFAGHKTTVRTEAAEFTQTPPTGYLSWMGEELVEPGWPVVPLSVSAPVFSVPAFQQLHILPAPLPINLSVHSYTTAPIVQRHVLAAPIATVSGLPVFGAILFKQVVPFSTSPLIVAPYTIGVPSTMTQAHKIVAPAMAVPSWSYVSAPIAQTHAITPIDKAAGLPVFGATGITLVVPMFADDLATSAPVIAAADATIRLALAASGFVGTGFGYANAVIHEINLLSAANLATGPPVQSAVPWGVQRTFTAAAFATSAPTLGASALTQRHPCVATNLVAEVPTIGTSALAQVHTFTAATLALSPPVDAIAENASVHIDFLAATGYVRGTGAVAISTLIGNDPNHQHPTSYEPTALTPYGYDHRKSVNPNNEPAWIGALRTAALSGSSIIIKLQTSNAVGGDYEEEFDIDIQNTGRVRWAWISGEGGYLETGMYYDFGPSLPDVWRYSSQPGFVNVAGFTFHKAANRFETAANNLLADSAAILTENNAPAANPMCTVVLKAWGPVASITAFDTLTLAQLQAKTVPVLNGTSAPLPIGTGQIKQLHVLSAPVSLVVTPLVSIGFLGQAGVFTPLPIVAGIPDIGVGALAQRQVLTAAYAAKSPVISSAIYSKNILPAPVAVTAPSIGASALTIALSADALVVLAPEIGEPAVTKRLAAANLAASVPAIAAGVLKQAHALAADPLVVAPDIPIGYLSQAGVFSLVPLNVSEPVIGTAAFKQQQVLAAVALSVAAPSIGQGVYGRVIPAIALAVTPPSVGTGPVLRKVLTPSGFASPAPTFPALPWLAVSFTAVDLEIAPAIGVGTIKQRHVLAGSSIAVLSPLTSPVVLGQAGVLQFMPLVAGQPTFTIPLLKQRHVLAATAAAVELPTIDSVAIEQEHRFDVEDAPQSVVVSAPVLGSRTIGQTHRLTAVLAPVAPVLAVVVLRQENRLGTAVGFSVATPTVSVATFGQGHLVTAQGVTGPSPFVGTSALGKVVQAEALAVGTPVIDAPQASVVLPAALPLVAGKPALGAPDCGAISGFGLPTLATSPPVIGAPLFKQRHQLDAEAIAVGAPVLPAPSFKAPEILVASSLKPSAPVFSRPVMVAYANLSASNFTVVAISLPHIPMGVRIDLVASDLAIDATNISASTFVQQHVLATTRIMPYPAIGEAQLGQDHGLAAADLVAGRPVVRVGFFGQAGTMAAIPLWVASPILPALAPRERHRLAAIGADAGAPSLGLATIGAVIAFPRAQSTYAGRFKGPAPVLGQAHQLIASTVTAGAPRALLPKLTASAPLGQPAQAVAGSPALGAPLMAVSSRLVPVGMRFGYPSLGRPQLVQEHVLAARDLETLGPLFQQIGFGAADLALDPIGIETAPPVLGEPRPPSRRARLYAIANVTGKRGNHVTITGRRHRTAI